MSYQDEDETAVLLGTTITPPTTTVTGFRWNRRVAVVAGMMMIVGGAAVFMFATMDGGRTRISAIRDCNCRDFCHTKKPEKCRQRCEQKC